MIRTVFGLVVVFLVLLSSAWASEQEDTAFGYAIRDHGGVFDRVSELNNYVEGIAERIAGQMDIAAEVVLLNASEPDLWVLPGGKIGMTRGMFAYIESESELAMVLAYGMQHAKTEFSKPWQSYRLDRQEVALRQSGTTNYALGEARMALVVLQNQVHGRIEVLQADRYGQDTIAQLGYDPGSLVTFLARLLELDEASGYLERHPPTEERLQRARENVNRLASRLGAERWSDAQDSNFSMVANALQASAAAFEMADKARERVPRSSIRWLDRAIEMVDDEPGFYSQKAGNLAEIRNCRQAIVLYTTALELDDNRYQDFLGRGQCYQMLGQWQEAKESYLESVRLLPNATAVKALADMALLAAQYQEAKGLYLTLMASPGHQRELAKQEFIALDLFDNPQIYFLSQTLVRDRELTTVITNQSGHAVRGLDVSFDVEINGEGRQAEVSAGALQVGGQVQLYPGLFLGDNDELSKIRVSVTRVRR